MPNDHWQDKLFELKSSINIPRRWLGTPIETFIMSQNFGYPLPSDGHPQLLLATCIEFRYSPVLPKNFAYVVRSPGGRLVGNEFAAAYAMARGVRNIILVAHDDCGMTHVPEAGPALLTALLEQGWKKDMAVDFIKHGTERFAIKDELSALEHEYHRLKEMFHAVHVAPLFVRLEEQKVHIPLWYHRLIEAVPV